VAGLPMIDRIEFLVDGVVRYAKDEAPYQYAWDTTAAPAIAQRSVTVAN
jgi:hypothetical protein